MNPVVLFYSVSGSTRRVAGILAKRLGAPAVEIKTKEPIRHPYGVGFLNRLKERTPEIAVDADLDAFDTFYIGGPTWYWTVTPPLLTLLRTHSFAGKTVVPFCTNDSQPGNFLARFAGLCPGADVKPGVEVQRVRRLSDGEIEKAVADALAARAGCQTASSRRNAGKGIRHCGGGGGVSA